MTEQPWIGKPLTETLFILLPPFFSLVVIALFPVVFQNNKALPEAGWVILILLVDVAHVYSTLYRTYFDPAAWKKQGALLIAIPVFSMVAGVVLYALNALWFWRVLTYTAVYHFVRQQYGFMRIYSRKEVVKGFASKLDTLVIYYSTLYPLLYWHLHGPRNFNWFIDGDFLFVQSHLLLVVATLLYYIILAVYAALVFYQGFFKSRWNLPKTAIITGTALSWYFGIVYFNGDLSFTLLNVVSHGIPYMALIWLYGEKNYKLGKKGNRFLRFVFSYYGLIVFLGLIFFLAFLEEGLWDLTVWKEHHNIFGTTGWTDIRLSSEVLTLLVPLLALPQITHYILDGFIWKVRKGEFK